MADREKIIKGLEFTKAMITFNPLTGEDREPWNLNEADKTSYDACVGAIVLLKEQEWIPVTERLPKSMINRVIVYVQHEDLTGYIGFGHFEKFKSEEMWYDLENNCPFSKRGYTVTHWMETPIPPMESR